MGQYQRHDFSGGWRPSDDAFNAAKNGLLRADNLMLDEIGALALRPGSAKINSSALATTDVHSLFTVTLNGSKVRMAGATDAVYADATSIATGIAGSGDIQFGSHMGQILFARSTTKKKYDGTTVRTWGIAAPAAAPTIAAVPTDFKVFATCDSTELPVFTQNEGTQTFQPDRNSTANAAVQIAVDSTTRRGTSTKTFTAPTTFAVYDGGTTGTDDDPVSAYVYVSDPKFIESIVFMFDVNDGTFQEDWYQYTMKPGDSISVTPTIDESMSSNYDVEAEERDRVRAAVEQRVSSVIGFRQDEPVTNVGWNRFQVPRGRFERHGLSSGQNWSTVKAIRLIVNTTADGTGALVRFDDIRISGGGLTGKYVARVVAAYDNGTYVALSGPSAASDEIELLAQGATVTVDGTTLAALDSQVTAIWVYLMGGRLNAFYRFATGTVTAGTGAFDYTSSFEDPTYFTSVEGIANYTSQFESDYGGTIGPKSHNYSWEEDYLPATDPLTITITQSELQALIANLRLETDNTVPPDTIVGIAGPHYDRTLCLTSQFIYPSRQLNPDSYSEGQAVRVGDATETALWIIKVGRVGLYVGTTRDIYEFDGDWTVQPDGSINVTKRPLHVSEPPISAAVEVGSVNGAETLIYLSGDGWHAFGHGPLVNNAVDLLWRGYTRHGVEFVNIAGATARFRCAVSKNVLFALTPEGSDTTSSDVIHAYHFGKQRWYRLVYPQAFRSIYAEYDGTLIAGDSSGFYRTLDLATKQDDGADIAIVLWTPVDDNAQPFAYKSAENLWMRLDTGDNTATIAFHLNGNEIPNTSTTTTQKTTDTANLNVSSIAEFQQLQLRITGSFSTFVMRGWGLRYLDYPAPQVIHDTGFVDLSGDILKWVDRLLIKARTPVDLTVTPYWDGTAGTVSTITAAAGDTVYSVRLGREDKGKVGRVVITSASPSHVYWVKFVFRGSGKPLDKFVSLVPEAA